jgi:hypothetical protein
VQGPELKLHTAKKKKPKRKEKKRLEGRERGKLALFIMTWAYVLDAIYKLYDVEQVI